MTPRKLFWIRFVGWVLFAVILPVVFLMWRFNLFAKVSHIQIGGWGLIAIGIVAIFVGALYKYMKRGLPYSLTTQVISGVVKIILPLGAAAFMFWVIRDTIDYVLQLLGVLIICEAIAIPINPMPKWVRDNRANEAEGLIDMLARRFEKKEEGK